MQEHARNNAANESVAKKPHYTIPPRQERLIVAAVLAMFVALAIGFSLGPILEGPDEIEHYRFVRLLADTWQLPNRMTVNHEYHQPPFYYALAAVLKMGVDDPDFDDIEARPTPGGLVTARLRMPNWQAQPSNDTTARLIHSLDEDFPYQSGTARAVHLIRLLSVMLGLVTVITCYAIFRLLWPDDPNRRLLSLGIVAFWPLFDYLSGYIVNDALLIFLSTLALFLTMHQIHKGPSLHKSVILGVVLGCAVLSKVNALVLAAPVGLAIFFDWRRAWRFGALTLAVTLAIGGWWYVQGAILYGDPTGMGVQYRVIPGSVMQPGEISFAETLTRLGNIYRLLWARFGWANNIVVAPPIYMFFDGITFIGVLGAVAAGLRWALKAWRRPADPSYLRMGAVVAMTGLVVFSSVYFFSTTYRTGAATARYLLPAIGVWASLLAYGLDFWVPRNLKAPVTLLGVTVFAIVATTCLLVYFLPAYQPLPLPSQVEHPLAIRYEDAAELVGVGDTTIQAHPGEIVTITLYWRAIQPSEHDLLTLVRVAGNKPSMLMNIPATGNLRSTEWQPGQTWTENWQIYIPSDVSQQTVYPVTIWLYDRVENRHLAPTDQDGRAVYSPAVEIVVSLAEK